MAPKPVPAYATACLAFIDNAWLVVFPTLATNTMIFIMIMILCYFKLHVIMNIFLFVKSMENDRLAIDFNKNIQL